MNPSKPKLLYVVFGKADGSDVILGFDAGAGSQDQIDLTDFGLADFADVIAAATETFGSTEIILPGASGGLSVTLDSIGIAELHDEDFLL